MCLILGKVKTPKQTKTNANKVPILVKSVMSELGRNKEGIPTKNPVMIVAKAGVLWGKVLTKVTGAMPDGLTMNGEGILSMYKEELATALEDVKSQSQPMDFFVG